MDGESMRPCHGGGRRQMAATFGVNESEIIDLSTGINPHSWSVPVPPVEVWQRLPEPDPQLIEAAYHYYGSESLLPVAGSQAAIQQLPKLRPHSRVGVVTPSYSEHQYSWQSAGHTLVELQPDEIEQALPTLDVMVVVNPNNPTGVRFSAERLFTWHQQLVTRGGWLIVDEAFIDATPEQSLCRQTQPCSGLIILRSLGKFFGLAGIRSGFVVAEASLLQQLQQRLGPWSLSHPAQWVARHALLDRPWQQQMLAQLTVESGRLATLLALVGLQPAGGCPLFQWVITARAAEIAAELAQSGILVRQFAQPTSLRFGLPETEAAWHQLGQTLRTIQSQSATVQRRVITEGVM